MVHIGKRLKLARKKAGLSQQDAADEIEVTRSTLANWEAGRHSPSLIQFRSLVTLYAASSYEILYGSSRCDVSREELAELSQLANECSPRLGTKLKIFLSLIPVTE